MAFSFIFAGAPGSVSNADRLMSIHNRQSVRQFCNDIRWRAAGGKEAVDKRLAQVAALEKEGNALIASNDFTAAYSKFEEASLLIGGDFTASLLTSTIKALMGLQKYEEAAGLAYHGVYVFDEKAPFYTLHDEIYRCMGYRDTSVWELLFDELPQKVTNLF